MPSRLPALPTALLLAPPLLAIAGCTVQPPAPRPAERVTRATIVAVRPLAPAGRVLTALGAPPDAAPTGGAREFILRTDDGRILSVVQDEAERARWQPGAAVQVIGGVHAHLEDGS